MKITELFSVLIWRTAEGPLFPAIRMCRRRFLQTVVAAMVLAATSPAAAPVAFGEDDDRHDDKHWVGTWTTSPRIPTAAAAVAVAFNNQTLRQIVYTSIGGKWVRVRLANTFGTVPLVIGAARIALRDAGAAIVPGSDRVLTFGEAPSITIEAGAYVLSDPVRLDVPELGQLAVSIYLPGSVGPTTPTNPLTYHATARQTNYFSPQTGDHTGDVDMPVEATSVSWWFLMGVDVQASDKIGAVVTLGDSITDGTASTLDANNRYPNYLARRLLARNGHRKTAVLNAGIAGNRVLTGGTSGPNAQARFDRDVLAQAGVKYVIFLEGINDIGNASTSPTPSAEDIIAGHKQLIARARELGLKIYGATLTPFEGTASPGYFTSVGEAKRQAVNEWIRTSGAYDAVIDFDLATRDPSHPTRFLPAYDSGDHLHPGDVGYEAMADAIPPEALQGR